MLLNLLIFFLISIPNLCDAHGAMTKPIPRDSEADPVQPTFEWPDDVGKKFVCRSGSQNPSGTTWQAGSEVEIGATFNIPHPGWCEFFISYDVAAARKDMKWLKIGNWKDCGIDRNAKNAYDLTFEVVATRNVYLPSWLPNGAAVFRFQWTAVHNYVPPEYYVQCSDVTIQSSTDVPVENTVGVYPLIKPSPIVQYGGDYNWWGVPDVDSNGVEWPNAQVEADFMTGLPCAETGNPTYNECAQTKPGTEGSIPLPQTATADPDASSTTSTESPMSTDIETTISTTDVEDSTSTTDIETTPGTTDFDDSTSTSTTSTNDIDDSSTIEDDDSTIGIDSTPSTAETTLASSHDSAAEDDNGVVGFGLFGFLIVLSFW